MIKIILRNIFCSIAIIFFVLACKKEDLHKVELNQLDNKSTYTAPLEISISDHLNAGYDIYLNDSLVSSPRLYLEEAGFYELIACQTNICDTMIFVVLDPERGEAEWGLKKWTPKAYASTDLGTAEIQCIFPSKYVSGIRMPIIFFTIDEFQIVPIYHEVILNYNQNSFHIKRGIGSINTIIESGITQLSFMLGETEKTISFSMNQLVEQNIDNTITTHTEIGSFKLLRLTKNVEISEMGILTIKQGTVVLLSEGVNIENYGSINIQGTQQNPVIFSCAESDKLWGGIISKGTGNEITLSNTIFTQSGYHTSASYQYGHAKRQALFYLENSNCTIDSCFIIDNKGQIFYPVNSNLSITNSVVQRAKTAGQINSTTLTVDHCYFSDFPNDNQEYSDQDNDGLYINASNATITNSTFMYAKDDGIDSGASEGGEISISNCHFEAVFHEGLALSSGSEVNKIHHITNCTFTNCGQGIELGYSSPNHVVTVDSCYVFGNNIGVRYGDNYTWQQAGILRVKNSTIVNNFDKDIWNMVRASWSPYVDKMNFINTVVSIPDDNYPDLIIQ